MPGEAIVTIRDRQWVVDLATTPQELATGLAGLPFLPPGTGMLFDMGAEQVVVVTTQAMLFPIDIVFISGALVVTELAPNAPPGQQVTSQGPARFFLEVGAGEAQGIEPGDQVMVQVVRPAQAAPGDMFSQLISLVVTVAVAGLLFSLVGGVVRAMLPGPKRERPVLYGPRGELLPQTREAPRLTRDQVRGAEEGPSLRPEATLPATCGTCPAHETAPPGVMPAACKACPAARLVHPPRRREAPEELEFFADSSEQCCASVDGTALRPQLETAFQEAIQRVRKANSATSELRRLG